MIRLTIGQYNTLKTYHETAIKWQARMTSRITRDLYYELEFPTPEHQTAFLLKYKSILD